MSTDLDDRFNDKPEPKPKAITRDDILNHLRWRTQQEVVTVKGPRLKKCALATQYAINLFAREKNELYKLGYTLTQPPAEKGRWIVTKWELVPPKVIIARQEAREMSRATSSDADIPRPEGMEYYPFQKAGIAFGITRRATLFGDEPGLGKSAQSIGVINCTPEAKKILIICPASLKTNWLRELNMWLVRKRTIFIADARMMPVLADGIVIQNYDNLQKHSDTIRDTEWDILIMDEAHYCLHGDTMVTTEHGPISIKTIVEEKRRLRVASFNSKDGKTEWKTIEKWYKTANDHRRQIRITHEHGTITCTTDHPIFVAQQGWTDSGKITRGQMLQLLREDILCDAKRCEQTPILQHIVQRKKQTSRSTIQGHQIGSNEGRSESRTAVDASRFSNQDDANESNATTGDCEENGSITKRKDIPSTWRKREKYETTDRTPCTARYRMEHGACDFDEIDQCKVQIIAESLQGRYRLPSAEDCRGDRRENTPDIPLEIPGQTENGNTRISRVESVEILEPAGRSGRTVYCIDVEGNHNFYANGILVHNCKNPDAKRTRVLFGDRCSPKERAMGMADLPPITVNHRKMLLTGTPICNRPKELFPLIHFLDPITWSSKSRYHARYCGACSDNGWNADGATNLAELQDKLRSTIMIRRLKKDVLTELPPKTRRVVEFAATGRMRDMIKAERDMFGSTEEYERAVESMLIKPIIGDRPTYRRLCAEEKARMPEVLAYMDDAVEESGKVVIFVWHREVYRLLRAHFGPRAVGMTGDTPQAERQAAVDSFQQSPAINVIIGQIITMGTGLTLTASNRVIMFELDDVPGNVTQAEDRCHRIGQKDNVLVEHLIVTGTIDARMARNCIEKQTIIDKALDREKTD